MSRSSKSARQLTPDEQYKGWGNQPQAMGAPPPADAQPAVQPWAGAPQQPQAGWPPQGYGPYQPSPPPPRRRRKWPWIVLGIAIVCIGGLIGIIAAVSGGVSHAIDAKETVVYKVTGSAHSATVTYTTWDHENSSTAQQDVTLPWSQTETSSGLVKGGVLTVSVDSGGGSVTCSVSVNGGTPTTSTASGAYNSATCDGTD
jgi:hypothetical protein